jgi:hypothetical protein
MMFVGCGAAYPPPPCGEQLGVGVAPKKAQRATTLYPRPERSILNHPHPYPPHEGEGADTPRDPIKVTPWP